MKHEITFVRLPEIDPGEIIVQMSDPRVAEHMPLLTGEWDSVAVTRFVETKEAVSYTHLTLPTKRIV